MLETIRKNVRRPSRVPRCTTKNARMNDILMVPVTSAPRIAEGFDNRDGASSIQKPKSGFKIGESIVYIAIKTRAQSMEAAGHQSMPVDRKMRP